MSAENSTVVSTLPPDSVALVGIVKKHWRLSLIAMVLLVLIGIPVSFHKGKPTYSTTGVLYVAPHFVGILKDSKELDFSSYQQFRQFIEHQALTVTRFDILLAALDRLGENRSVWQLPNESDRRAAERLRSALKVVAVENSYLITVSLDAEQQQGLDLVVNAVIATFLEKSHEADSFFARDRRVGALKDKKRTKLDEVEGRTKRRNEISEQLGITLFSDAGTNPYDELLLVSEKALVEAHQNVIQSESSLLILQDPNHKQGQEALAASVYESVQGDSGLSALRSGLYNRRSELLKQISGMKDNHPLAIQIRTELQDIEDELKKVSTDISERSQKNLLDKVRSDVRRFKQIEIEVSNQVVELRKKAAHFAVLYNEALGLTKDLDRDRKSIEEMDNRIEFFEMESQAPGFMRVESEAMPPELPVKGGRKKIFLMFVFLGIAVGLALPFVIEKLDRRLKTPGEVGKVLGRSPLGVLVDTRLNAKAHRFVKDQLRRLAMTLLHEAQDGKGRVVLLTSVKSGAGVTGTTIDLATHLIEMGKKVLVIETNSLNSDFRYAPDHERLGLSDYLKNASIALEAIIHRPWRGGADCLSLGSIPGSHLPAIGRMGELLSAIKPRYDLILLDASPVLFASDTEWLVRQADITLLLVASRQVRPDELKRTLAILEKLNPPAMGLVMTGLETPPGTAYHSLIEELSMIHRPKSLA